MDISTSKTGKHGHAKANITAIDIFTGKKLTEVKPTSANLYAPNGKIDGFPPLCLFGHSLAKKRVVS